MTCHIHWAGDCCGDRKQKIWHKLSKRDNERAWMRTSKRDNVSLHKIARTDIHSRLRPLSVSIYLSVLKHYHSLPTNRQANADGQTLPVPSSWHWNRLLTTKDCNNSTLKMSPVWNAQVHAHRYVNRWTDLSWTSRHCLYFAWHSATPDENNVW